MALSAGSYAMCQSACNAGAVACFGTITTGAAAIATCNTTLAACITACATKIAAVEESVVGASTAGGWLAPVIIVGGLGVTGAIYFYHNDSRK
mmetsp:Transcript_7682/g.18950  ORF Transcript_7682/g.18950 Transcript_7682/m.18950 type:complete len:93 (-) Transcript_7682:656-934(-)